MSYISAELRRLVMQRAGYCCEYCQMNVADRLLPFEIDHVISEKHGGPTSADNLCLACYCCNGFKGSDIAGADPQTGLPTFLYNPRTQQWKDHFLITDALIKPLTPEGRITAFLLRLNAPIQIEQRRALITDGRYPCEKPSG